MERLIKFHTNRSDDFRLHTIIAGYIAGGRYTKTPSSHIEYMNDCEDFDILSVSYNSWQKAFEKGWE